MELPERASDLLSSSAAERTSAIRSLRFARRGEDLIEVVAEHDPDPFVRLEAMAMLAERDQGWRERLELEVIAASGQLYSYGDYLLRELAVWPQRTSG